MSPSSCIVCGKPGAVSAVEVAGKPVDLCHEHVRTLEREATRSFDSLAVLRAAPGIDKRLEVDRRRDDRRMFPPRPELRRSNQGRRDDDSR